MNDDIIKDIYDNIFKSVGKELYSNLYEPFSKGLIMMSRSLKNDIEQYNKQNINTLNQQSEDIKQSTTRLRQSFDNYTHSLNNFNNIFQNAIKTFNNKINDLDEYIKQTKADFYKNDIQEYKDAKRRYINSGDNEVDRQLLSDAISKFNEKQSINDEIIKLQREINHNAPEINKKLEELQKETILRDIRSKSSDIEHQYDVGKAILRDNENNDYEIKKRLEIAEYMSAIDSDTIKNIEK